MRGAKSLIVLGGLCSLLVGCAHQHHHHHVDGRLTLEDVPPVVRDHFNRDHPNVVVRSIERDTQGAVTIYYIKFADQGVVNETEYDREGDEIKQPDQ